MAKFVNSAFIEFLNNTVNIDASESINAKKSRDYLITQINNISKNGKFIKLHHNLIVFLDHFQEKQKYVS